MLIVKTPQGEMSLEYLCNMEYKKINTLMLMVEQEFDTDMNNHQELRHAILDISNFIKRLPQMVEDGE